MSGHVPALHAIVEPRVGSGTRNRSQHPACPRRRALPRHWQDGKSGILHREPARRESPRTDFARAERENRDTPCDRRPEARRQGKTPGRDKGFHSRASWQKHYKVFLYHRLQQQRRQPCRPCSLHISRTQPAQQGDGDTDDGRRYGSGVAQPERAYRRVDYRTCQQDNRRTDSPRADERRASELPRRGDHKESVHRAVAHNVPHPRLLPRTDKERQRATLPQTRIKKQRLDSTDRFHSQRITYPFDRYMYCKL